MSRGEREMDARESASERDDAEMSDSDDEGPRRRRRSERQ